MLTPIALVNSYPTSENLKKKPTKNLNQCLWRKLRKNKSLSTYKKLRKLKKSKFKRRSFMLRNHPKSQPKGQNLQEKATTRTEKMIRKKNIKKNKGKK